MRAWAAPPTCMSRGLRAYQGVYAHTQGLTCERAMWLSGRYHPGQAPDNVREQPIPPGTAQNAGYFATSSLFSVFFTEVVCVLGATSPRTAAALPPVGGNCIIRAATRRRHAVRAPLMLQNPHRHQPDVRRITYKSWAQDRLARNNSPNTAPPVAFPRKTRPASAKTPNLGCCERAGRTFSRFRDLTAMQGELFRACRRRPSSALPISDRAPLVWRAPADPESPAAVPVGGGRALP